MAIDWQTTRAALIAALPAASPVAKSIGQSLLADLKFLGSLYDRRFPLGRPTLLTESSAHVQWRTVTMPESIADLNEIAAEVDGEPVDPVAPGSDLDALWDAAIARCTAALGSKEAPPPAPLANLLTKGLAAPKPAEPRFYVDEYYEGVKSYDDRGRGPNVVSDGDLESQLSDKVSEATVWLGIAT